jgi:cysteine desulfurase
VSVLHPCRELAKHGYAVTYVPVDGDGLVDPASIAAAIRSETFLVSVMAANGEVGAVQPIREIARVTRERGIALHVDGVHALGRIALDVEECGIDFLSLSSNDLYGPPGVGALWMRPAQVLAPLTLGGGQEHGYRSGTENVPGIVGMGVAADVARTEGLADSARLASLRDRLLEALLESVRDVRITGPRDPHRLPHHASIVVPRVKADALLMELDATGIAASSGSACNALTGEPSHVLTAIGCTRDEAEGSLCFTSGRWTTESDIDAVIDVLPRAVERLRQLSAR